MAHSKKRFNPQEAIVPGISLLFGIAYFVQTTDASWVAIKWPYALAVLAALLWLGVVAVYVFSKGENRGETKCLPGLKLKPMLILVAPILYIVLMPYLGFALSSLLFLTLLFRSLDGRSWLRNATVAFIITAFLYVAMILLMQMSLPRLEIGSFLL